MIGRRPVGGPPTLEPRAPARRPAGHGASGELETLLGAIDEVRAIADTDLLLRRTIELARDRFGLRRAGIFLIDRSRRVMLGTWGMDLSCAVVNEHHVVYDLCGTDLEALRRSEDDGTPFAVFEGCPIIEHQGGETRVAGRGWVAKTPIRATHGTVGMLFNDAAMTDDWVDEAKQSLAAILCTVVGAILDPIRGGLRRGPAPGTSPSQKLVMSTVSMLNKDPGLGGKQIAAALDISLSRLARVFKVLMGMSLVEYRNRLRLERFEALLDRGHTSLLDVALQAGFGSYAQFHRVFRAQLRVSPRDYLHPSSGEPRQIRRPRRPRTTSPSQPTKPAR
ncbi:MAG TPA: helix-turn-helix transcriptional regulator [Polyangia bacterium]|nr:helix-turn-helix transcriptional regulator [Polyangia bacterium]